MKLLRKLKVDRALLIYVLNLLDLLFTLYAVSHGGTELNPVANLMLMLHPLLYAFYKIAVIGVLLWWLRKRDSPITNIGLKIVTIVYAGIVLQHITALYYIHLL